MSKRLQGKDLRVTPKKMTFKTQGMAGPGPLFCRYISAVRAMTAFWRPAARLASKKNADDTMLTPPRLESSLPLGCAHRSDSMKETQGRFSWI
jgi:hypothetical protein